jgi:hypothetical protein
MPNPPSASALRAAIRRAPVISDGGMIGAGGTGMAATSRGMRKTGDRTALWDGFEYNNAVA